MRWCKTSCNSRVTILPRYQALYRYNKCQNAHCVCVCGCVCAVVHLMVFTSVTLTWPCVFALNICVYVCPYSPCHIDINISSFLSHHTNMHNQVMSDPNNNVTSEPSNHGSIVVVGDISPPNVDWVNGFKYDCTRKRQPVKDEWPSLISLRCRFHYIPSFVRISSMTSPKEINLKINQGINKMLSIIYPNLGVPIPSVFYIWCTPLKIIYM